TSFQSTVPVASSVTWKMARPRDAFVAAAQCGTSSSALRTATNVLGDGASATAAVPIAAKVRAAVARATDILRMSTSHFLDGLNKPNGQRVGVGQIPSRRSPRTRLQYARTVPGSIRVARIFGIDINVHFSWIVIFFVIVTNLSEAIYPDQFPQWSRQKTFVVSAVSATLFFVSVVAHELAHSLVARRFQLAVASITLFTLGGVASLTREPPSAKAELFMAAAGPLTSIVVGIAGVIIGFAADAALATATWFAHVYTVAGSIGPCNLICAWYYCDHG